MNDKKRGKLRAKGKRLTFVTGDYRTLYFGKWSTVNGVYGKSHVIKLYGKKDRKEKLSCTRRLWRAGPAGEGSARKSARSRAERGPSPEGPKGAA